MVMVGGGRRSEEIKVMVISILGFLPKASFIPLSVVWFALAFSSSFCD